MGTYTTNYNLFMPTVGETGWGTLVNGNFATIDSTMKGLDTRIDVIESVIHVDENQNATFPAKITATEFVGGVGNFSSTITNTLGVPFNAIGVKYAEGGGISYNTKSATDWVAIGSLTPPTSGYPQWLKITPPECKVTGNLRCNQNGYALGVRFVNSSGEVEYTFMHSNPSTSYYAQNFECILNPYDTYTVEFYTTVGSGYNAYLTVSGLSIQA